MTQGGGTFLLWADLSPEDLARLDGAVDEAATKAVLADVLRVLDGENPLRAQVLLEFYANNLAFARERGFSAEKTSTFFSIMKRNHDEMVEAFLPQQKSWEYLQALVLAHAVQRPPYSVGIFQLSEVRDITQYALDSYYRNFALYRYAFTMRHVKEITTRSCWTELPPATFPSLADGLPTEEAAPPADAAPAAEAAPPPPIALDIEVPDAVKAAVEEQIATQVAAMRAALEAQYAEKTAATEAKLAALEAK
jgi:hypothetical protein